MFKGMWKMVFRNRPSLATNLTATFQKSDHFFLSFAAFWMSANSFSGSAIDFQPPSSSPKPRGPLSLWLLSSYFSLHIPSWDQTIKHYILKQKRRNLLDTILWTSISVVKVFPLSTWKTSIGHSLWTDCPITGHFQDWSKKVETLQYYSICVIDVFDV